jgi:hypothetical protein
MTAKLFYRLVDAAAEKVYRATTVLGPAVGGAVFVGMARASRNANPHSETDCLVAASTGHFPNGESAYSDVRCLKYMDE